MVKNINIGSVQAPYLQTKMTLKAGETRVFPYVFDSFNLLLASIPDVLEVTFGGAAVQSKFSSGMGYKLNEPVSYIQFFNTSENPLEIEFSLAIGGITDNRLTVSGVINTISQQQCYLNVMAGTLTAPQSLEYDNNSIVALVCTSGSITVNISASQVSVTNLELSAGQAWEMPIASGGTIEITGTGTFNYSVAGY